VPGTGSPIYLSFTRSEGDVTGKLFPTGKPVDWIQTKNSTIPISIIDVANPLVFVRAEDVGLKGNELPHEYTPEKLKELEEIRSLAAEMCHFSKKEEATKKSPAVPKMTLVAPPMDFIHVTGIKRNASEMDLAIRMMSMQKPHQALAITGAICTTAGAFLKDTILADIVTINHEVLRLAHPAGIMETKVDLLAGNINSIKVVRTARTILEGSVFTKDDYQLSDLAIEA
ncbi:PrpF domain-containing protein, partial [Neobacillus drentensis]|uniref:PrpF domain-containing protein n=1 Tax=Neobacillus drentensis TaxID=220684 RepID=UPI002FFDE2F9